MLIVRLNDEEMRAVDEAAGAGGRSAYVRTRLGLPPVARGGDWRHPGVTR